MKALTIYQPWASLIALGLKAVEFRSRPCPARLVGQRVVIHAGATDPGPQIRRFLNFPEEIRESCGYEADRLACLVRLGLWDKEPSLLPLGAGIATAVLGRPRPADEHYREFAERVGLDLGPGPFAWAWPLTGVRRWDQEVPARGQRGFWEWRP